MTTQITVTRALAQVKSLNDRIQRATMEPFLAISLGEKVNGYSVPRQEVEQKIGANLQSVQALIVQRDKLKAAIVRSNATTEVEIGSKKMTVAEAIERKTSIALDVALLTQLSQQRRKAQGEIERVNADVETRATKLVETAVGKDRKVSEDEIKAIREPFIKANQAALVDPNKVDTVIQELQAAIDDFRLNVDFALSESNAITKISVE